ncbi:MAG: hypothetical protein U0V70_22240, partial [Terriglobia bacterium]
EAIGTPGERRVLDSIYEIMPSRNFSSDCLQSFASELAVVELNDVLWSDWGRHERILESLRQIGRTPAFSVLGDWKPKRADEVA